MVCSDLLAIRRRVLEELGGNPAAVRSVLRCTDNQFDWTRLPPPPVLPLPDEPHLADWRTYAAACGSAVFAYLQDRLAQLCIPIRRNISLSRQYAEVVYHGRPFSADTFGGKLTLERPAELRLVIHEHPAGALPVLITSHRPDFLALDWALAYRSEPESIGPAVNAHMIGEILNWDRLRRKEPTRSHDQLLLLCRAPYSGIKAELLGLRLAGGEAEWVELSTTLRLEHEFTHYLFKRLLGRMKANLFDELLCDWAGLTAALGRFEARWFLTFLGLEDWPALRKDGRVHIYRGELDEAFDLLCALMVGAAQGLEQLTRHEDLPANRVRLLLALARMMLELLACEEREAVFAQAYAEVEPLLGA
jgi:hypothetical protein